jgi:hypothetical protein
LPTVVLPKPNILNICFWQKLTFYHFSKISKHF